MGRHVRRGREGQGGRGNGKECLGWGEAFNVMGKRVDLRDRDSPVLDGRGLGRRVDGDEEFKGVVWVM